MGFKYRADHVGSLLRPQEVYEAHRNTSLSREQRKAIEDRHILRILERQRDLGFKIFTDGELRRRGFMSDFYESVSGLDNDGSIARQWYGGSGGSGVLTGIVVERIQQTKRLAKHESEFLMANSPGDVKMTLPTANQFPAIAFKKGISERA